MAVLHEVEKEVWYVHYKAVFHDEDCFFWIFIIRCLLRCVMPYMIEVHSDERHILMTVATHDLLLWNGVGKN